MPTEAESTVLRLLSSIEVDPDTAAKTIESLGNEGVTVLCDTALGSFPGLRPKVRTNAVALLGWMNHPQTQETIRMLIRDPHPDVSIRALRAAGRQKDVTVVRDLDRLLRSKTLLPLVAVEVVKALIGIDSTDAQQVLNEYDTADPSIYPHRGSDLVASYMRSRPK